MEGFVTINRTDILNNWRSSFTPNDSTEASQFKSDGKTLYCLEVVKYFNKEEANSMNQVGCESKLYTLLDQIFGL